MGGLRARDEGDVPLAEDEERLVPEHGQTVARVGETDKVLPDAVEDLVRQRVLFV